MDPVQKYDGWESRKLEANDGFLVPIPSREVAGKSTGGA